MIFICTLATLLQIVVAQIPHHLGSSACALRIPLLLSESGVNLTDVRRCGDLSLPYVPFSSVCKPGSGNFVHCAPPIVIQRCKSEHVPGALSTPETSNTTINDTSSPEVFIECILQKKGVCNRTYHHFVDEVIQEIPNKLGYDLKCTAGNHSVSSISVAHCNSMYIENVFCEWKNVTVITKPSNSLIELLTNYVHNEEKIVTGVAILYTSCRLEYYIKVIDSPITDYFNFNFTLEELVNYNTLLNYPHLKQIQIQHLNMSRFPPNLFQQNKKLTSCAITHIMLEEVPPGLFSSAVDLTRVDLSDNKLQTLPEGIFENNPSLRHLILARNKLKYLPTTLLPNNNNVSLLDLSYNQLEDLQLAILKNPPETTLENFTNSRPVPKTFGRRYRQWLADEERRLQIVNTIIKTTTITKVDLRYNQLKKIPNEVLDASIVLTIFRASFNREVRNLTGSHSFYALQEFSMSDCGIISIDEDFFSKSSDNKPLFIRKIDLNRNQLNILHRRTFWNCRELETLWLNKNKLTKLENDLFKDLINLKHLDVSGNMLSTFQYEAFNLQKVNYLDFSWNRIHDFNPENMIALLESGFGFVKRLDISHNCLTTKKVVLPSIKANRPLFYKHVAINYKYKNSTLANRGFDVRQYSPTQSFGNDTNNKDEGNTHLQLFLEIRIGPVEAGGRLCPNPFKQFCTEFPHSCHDISDTTWNLITERLKHLNLMQCREGSVGDNSNADTMECPFTPTCSVDHYKSILTSVIGNYDSDVSFTCPVNDSCPPFCRCYQRAVENEIVVDCNGKGLSHLPLRAPLNTNILYFNNNALRTLQELNSSMWSNLTELYLENNNIVSVDIISLPSKLRIVSLRNNQIESIEKDSLDMLREVEFSLSGNPLLCDCNARFLKAKLVGISKVKDAKLLFCASFNDTLINVPDDVLCPTKVYFTLSLRLGLCLGIALPLSIGILFALYYRNKLFAKAFVFTYFPGISRYCCRSGYVDSDKEFDAFLAYNSSDRDIVMQMIEELESKEPSFKLCIHERDWIPGNPIVTNIATSVSSSRKTIIILSMSFIQSTWLPVEVQTVYHQMVQDKINRSIIVVRGKIPRASELDTYLQLLLRTKTYLVWNERWFWEKLRYALSHKDFSSLEPDGPSSDFVAKVEEDIVKFNRENVFFC